VADTETLEAPPKRKAKSKTETAVADQAVPEAGGRTVAETPRPGHKDVHAAKVAVMREVRYVQKKRSQEGGVKFAFASEEAFLKLLNPALARHGLDVTPVKLEVIGEEKYQTKQGGTWRFIRVLGTYELCHGDSGTKVTCVGIGEGTDSGDKAAYKAQTGAYKYALWKTFAIATGDDPEFTDSRHAEPARPGQRPAQAAQGQRPLQGGVPGAPDERGYSETYFRRKRAVLAARDKGTLDGYQAVYKKDMASVPAEVKGLDFWVGHRLSQLAQHTPQGPATQARPAEDAPTQDDKEEPIL
jgi:hypothetical protein